VSYPALGFPPPEGDGQPPDYVERTTVDYPDDPPPPGGPPRGGRRLWWVAAAVAAVVVLGVGALLAVDARRSPTSDTTVATVSAPPIPPALPPPSTPPPPPPCKPALPGTQTPAGWKPVSSNVGLTYDVPPEWTVEGCGVRLGWEKVCKGGLFDACPIEILRAAAQLESATCPDNWLAVSGLDSPNNPRDLNRAVRDKAALVRDIYTSTSGQVPEVTLTDPRGLILDATPALQILATVTGIEAGGCGASAAVHSVVAINVPGQDGAVVFVVSLYQGIPGAPNPRLIDDLVATLRHT
jgi:hypothetical protein